MADKRIVLNYLVGTIVLSAPLHYSDRVDGSADYYCLDVTKVMLDAPITLSLFGLERCVC